QRRRRFHRHRADRTDRIAARWTEPRRRQFLPLRVRRRRTRRIGRRIRIGRARRRALRRQIDVVITLGGAGRRKRERRGGRRGIVGWRWGVVGRGVRIVWSGRIVLRRGLGLGGRGRRDGPAGLVADRRGGPQIVGKAECARAFAERGDLQRIFRTAHA